MTTISFTVNATPVTVETDPLRTLVDVLRDTLGLTGTKQGCDGARVRCLHRARRRAAATGPCITLAASCEGRAPHRDHRAAVHARPHSGRGLAEGLFHSILGAVQCGFCTPGMVIAAEDLLRDPDPTTRGPRGHLRQPLPLHGLCEDH